MPHTDSPAYPAPVAFVLKPWDDVPFVNLLDHQHSLVPVVEEKFILEINRVSVIACVLTRLEFLTVVVAFQNSPVYHERVPILFLSYDIAVSIFCGETGFTRPKNFGDFLVSDLDGRSKIVLEVANKFPFYEERNRFLWLRRSWWLRLLKVRLARLVDDAQAADWNFGLKIFLLLLD